MRTDANEWIYDSKDTVIDRTIDHLELPAKSRTFVSGRIAADPWKLVNEPLQPEFLPGRQWNKFGAQLAVAPTYGGIHPHYDRILQHIGSGLDDAVKNDPWCQQHGILSGAQYFLIWCAVLFRDPKQHLPMLYLFSQSRDNGKSAFYKALGLLISRGFVEGVRMLNEPFNKMMAGALLVYLDEERVEGRNAQKMKLWIDNDKISLRLMRTDAFMFDNFSHWIATYNFTDGVPVEDGDERVVMVELPTLYDEDKLDWKLEMRPALEAERTDFLGTLMTMELPPSGGRLYLPVLSTPLKEKVMAGSDKSGCNLDELLARTVAVVQERGGFVGMSGEFAKLLGPGSWESSLNHLRRYLRKIEPELPRHGINADLSDARVIVLNQVS
jgi:hypothetical protein